MRLNRFFLFSTILPLCFPVTALANNADPYVLTLKNGRFSPAELSLPAGKKVKLTVKNENPTPAEFESASLDREQVVAAHDFITLYLGPLDPGTYNYFDDFNHKITGKIEVK
jgi:hypothetical protein